MCRTFRRGEEVRLRLPLARGWFLIQCISLELHDTPNRPFDVVARQLKRIVVQSVLDNGRAPERQSNEDQEDPVLPRGPENPPITGTFLYVGPGTSIPPFRLQGGPPGKPSLGVVIAVGNDR